jgi:2-isopropylmalate synthase
LEEVVMAIKTRKDILGCETQINSTEIMKTSRLVSHITGSMVQPNKAIVGSNAFAHEAGIHQDGILKKRQTYEIMDAEMVGLKDTNLVLGKHSGRHAFKDKLVEMGYDLKPEELNKAFERFKSLADVKKDILDEDLGAIVADQVYSPPVIYDLKYVQIVAGNTTKSTACVQLEKDGKLIEGAGMGAGPVDCVYRTIDTLIGEDVNLVDFLVHSVTGGTDALADVTVRIRDGERIFTGKGSSLDVLVASTKAYLAAVNKMIYFRGQDPKKAQ